MLDKKDTQHSHTFLVVLARNRKRKRVVCQSELLIEYEYEHRVY